MRDWVITGYGRGKVQTGIGGVVSGEIVSIVYGGVLLVQCKATDSLILLMVGISIETDQTQ